jgi:hypothetical protein
MTRYATGKVFTVKKQIVIFSITNLLSEIFSMLGLFWVANMAGPSFMGAYNFLQQRRRSKIVQTDKFNAQFIVYK